MIAWRTSDDECLIMFEISLCDKSVLCQNTIFKLFLARLKKFLHLKSIKIVVIFKA